MSSAFDPYAVLGVARTADAVTVHAAFRLRALEHHPDRACGSTMQMQAVTRAHSILSDDARRAAWDRATAQEARPAPPPQPVRPDPPAPPPAPPAPTPKSNGEHRPSTRTPRGGPTARPRSASAPPNAALRVVQWSAVVVVMAGLRDLTLGGGDVLMAMAAGVLAVRVIAVRRPAGEPFWPLHDARSVLRELVGLVRVSVAGRAAS